MVLSKSFHIRALLFLLMAAAMLLPSRVGYSTVLPGDNIRVAIVKGGESITLDGSGILVINEEGVPLLLNFPLQVRRDRNRLSLNGVAAKKIVAAAPAFLKVNGKGYRGAIEVSPGDKGLIVVNELPLEEYLVGLINCEISSQWPIEAVKAQAVIARSYAVFQKEQRKNAPYQLESTVMDQVYEGCDIEDTRAARGVRETAGEVLTFDGKVVQAFYHSSCGGHTEASENSWGYPLPYLKGVDCKYCMEAPSVRWEQTLKLKKLESLMKNAGHQVTGLRDIRPGRRNDSGRLMEVVLVSDKGRVTLSGVNFRKAVGYGVIKSTNFEVRVNGDEARFAGAGYGHGVGLCQWGAKNRALEGFSYREILNYYYPGTRVEKAY